VGFFQQSAQLNPTEEIAQVRTQLEEISKVLAQKRTAYQQQSAELIAVETQFHVNHSFRLDPEIAGNLQICCRNGMRSSCSY
jgi:hypothetical protein